MSTSFAQNLENDRLALIKFYNATGGNGWYQNTGWNVPGSPGDSPCDWFGIGCNSERTRVTELRLPNNILTGSLPVQIGELTALVVIDLHRNLGAHYVDGDDAFFVGSIAGNIPSEIGNLVNLEYLNLGGSDFAGSIPPSIGNLVNLKLLDISYSDWEGGFGPHGNLRGSLPSELGYLTNLVSLTISGQNATGNIPATLGNLKELETLNLYNNKFSGPIPTELSTLSKLKNLNLGYDGFRIDPNERNKHFGGLIGPMPDWSGLPSIAKINVQYQSLNFDGMEGNISRLISYTPQAKLIINRWSAELKTLSNPSGIYIDAGGSVVNNTYKLYKDNMLISTQTGNKYLQVLEKGIYRIEVNNSMVSGLTLVSEDYNVTSLPVALSYFIAKKQSAGNFLTWQTTSETTNKGFEIERSKDAINFENIGFMDGNGDSKATNDYGFLDKNPFPLSYYRLKQIDYDGKFEYSRIIYVKKDDAKLSFYPNPVKDQLFVSGLEKEENVTIHNLEGRLILDQKLLPSQPVNTGNFSTGLYIIKVGDETKKVMIQN